MTSKCLKDILVFYCHWPNYFSNPTNNQSKFTNKNPLTIHSREFLQVAMKKMNKLMY